MASGGNMMHDIEHVINSYEAEEERIVNVLSRKLEQVSPHVSIGSLSVCLQVLK